MPVRKIAQQVRVIGAGAEPLRSLAAYFDDLIDQGAGPVLGEGAPTDSEGEKNEI